MRLCRFRSEAGARVGLYLGSQVVDLGALWTNYSRGGGRIAIGTDEPSLLDFLPPSKGHELVKALGAFYLEGKEEGLGERPITFGADEVELLAPIPRPSKLLFLAGNYAEHVEEGGERAEVKERTFPYFFMKPPSTTVTDPGKPIRRPAISPDHIDWEVELAVIIGRPVKGIGAADALSAVAGYTVAIDVSDREFEPNPRRRERPMDDFFAWMMGKWHDGFAPMGPCVTPPEEIPDPQSLRLSLKVNGETMQDSNTGRMVFTVAELIEFISGFVTLEPGDIISTGTPSGIGATAGRFLRPGDVIEAEIERIGVLRNPVE
jgi:2-keto-4-pentenoate hydratase/2-oxohepta-3-ene-1,7-dioic acid hydratase in catechol pathway